MTSALSSRALSFRTVVGRVSTTPPTPPDSANAGLTRKSFTRPNSFQPVPGPAFVETVVSRWMHDRVECTRTHRGKYAVCARHLYASRVSLVDCGEEEDDETFQRPRAVAQSRLQIRGESSKISGSEARPSSVSGRGSSSSEAPS